MNINKYLLLSSMVLLVASCSDKDPISPTPDPTPGKEIQFGASLEDEASSRTAYDDETADKVFPIKWMKHDKVFIHSPHVTSDQYQSTYKVPDEVVGETGAYAAGQLVKHEGNGIVWGNEEKANFYSVYPSRYVGYKSGNEESPSNDDERKQASAEQGSHIIKVDMTDLQTCKYATSKSASTIPGDASTNVYHLDSVDRYGAIMYAKTTDVLNSQKVNLKYKQLATALRVKLKGLQKISGQPDPDPVTLTQVILKAPVPIAGEFDVDFENECTVGTIGTTPIVTPKVTAGTKTQNEIKLKVQYNTANESNVVIGCNDEIELNFFLMLATHDAGGTQKSYTINNDWSIQLVFADAKPLTKKLGTSAGVTANLVPSTIHRLADLPNISNLEEWEIARWMIYIPRNVYLSELSIPGSWNSLNPDFQTQSSGSSTEAISKATIDEQYKLGCRAFHLDTRFRRINATSTDFTNLGIANGGDTAEPVGGGGKKVMKKTACPLFSEALGYITENVKKDEYMVVICTFAQNSYEGADWRQKVSDACASNDAVYDASKISANTTVGDVLGKVIVIVNCEGAIPSIPGSKCLFVNAPLTLSASTFSGGYPSETLYKGNGASELSLNYVQAQVTSNDIGFDTGTGSPLTPLDTWRGENRGYAPNLSQRQTIGGNILSWSSQNVTLQNYKHKDWIFLGLGGYLIKPEMHSVMIGFFQWEDQYYKWDDVSGSYSTVANNLNNWINGKVDAMKSNKAYYPIGIVLMNKVDNETYGKPVVKNILQLNNRYNLKYDSSKEAFPDDDTTTKSKAPGYSSGMVDKNEDAIGWQ